MNSQLKNYFGRSIKRLNEKALRRREERRERITLLRVSLIKSEDPCPSSASPIT